MNTAAVEAYPYIKVQYKNFIWNTINVSLLVLNYFFLNGYFVGKCLNAILTP